MLNFVLKISVSVQSIVRKIFSIQLNVTLGIRQNLIQSISQLFISKNLNASTNRMHHTRSISPKCTKLLTYRLITVLIFQVISNVWKERERDTWRDTYLLVRSKVEYVFYTFLGHRLCLTNCCCGIVTHSRVHCSTRHTSFIHCHASVNPYIYTRIQEHRWSVNARMSHNTAAANSVAYTACCIG